MRKKLFTLVLPLLWLATSPCFGQPWLEVAEKYLPAVVDPSDRAAYRVSLVHAYARGGEFARVQALIDSATGPVKVDLGVMAAIGALKGGYTDQALRWAELYLPASELTWDKPEHLAHGSDRERFLRSAPTPEAAAQALELLRAHGSVGPGALAFVVREIGGMPLAVSDFYLREFAKVSDSARPVDWIQIEESTEASGSEFAPLEKQMLEVLLANQPALVEQLTLVTPNARRAEIEAGVKKYIASLLARQGRFLEAETLWNSAGPNDLAERKLYLQNQYLGGRKAEALSDLVKITGLEEDAKVQLSLFLLSLNHFEEAKPLGTDPVSYLDIRSAKLDLQRGENVDKWLSYAADLDTKTEPADSVLWVLAHDSDIPKAVREKALSAVADPAAPEKACQAHLLQAVQETLKEEAGRVTLRLLILDDDIHETGCQPGTEALEVIEKLKRTVPIVTEAKE